MIGGSTVHSILCRLVDTWRDPNIFEDLKKRLIAFKSHVRVSVHPNISAALHSTSYRYFLIFTVG